MVRQPKRTANFSSTVADLSNCPLSLGTAMGLTYGPQRAHPLVLDLEDGFEYVLEWAQDFVMR